MGNQRTRRRPTDAQWRQLYSSPPDASNAPLLDDVMQADRPDWSAAERLLAEADIDLSGFLASAQERIQTLQRRTGLSPAPGRPIESLTESEFMELTDEDVLCFLEAEGIDCGAFLTRVSELIENNRAVLPETSH